MTTTITRRQLPPNVVAVSHGETVNRPVDEPDCSSSFHYLFHLWKSVMKMVLDAQDLFSLVWAGYKSLSHWTLQSTCHFIWPHTFSRAWDIVNGLGRIAAKKWTNHIIGQMRWEIWCMGSGTKKNVVSWSLASKQQYAPAPITML